MGQRSQPARWCGKAGEARLGAAWADMARRPYEYLVRRWNWKAAVTSATIRGGIFFATNLGAGRDAALGAMVTEFGYRTLLSGSIGSVIQALRACEPAWAAALTASVVLPIISHLVEFTVHFLRGTPRIKTSIGVSVGFTVISALFNLYAMRRGVLVVGGQGSQTLIEDLAALPRIFAGFISAGPLALWRLLRRSP
jgi:hypothetical protein